MAKNYKHIIVNSNSKEHSKIWVIDTQKNEKDIINGSSEVNKNK
jgi:hypothetical protein